MVNFPGGIKVRLAGRTAYLPNEDAPVVFQSLTMGQIAAIPRDRFAVSLVEMVNPSVMPMAGHKGHGAITNRKQQRLITLARQASGGKVIGFIRTPGNTILPSEPDGTKQFVTIISLTKEIGENAKDIYDILLALSRNQGDTPPEPDSGLFVPPIDDGDMLDCIKKAIAHFFGEKDICMINGTKYKPAAFCLLMHDYFRRIGIMRNTTLKPFCDFLQKRVLKAEMQFTSRTLTNYANEYKNYENDFTSKDGLKFNFDAHPEPTGKIIDAFHEIGHFFHTSKYFTHLREMRDNLNTFKI